MAHCIVTPHATSLTVPQVRLAPFCLRASHCIHFWVFYEIGPWGIEPHLYPPHGHVLPVYYGPRIGVSISYTERMNHWFKAKDYGWGETGVGELGVGPKRKTRADGARCGQANFQQKVMRGPVARPDRAQAKEAWGKVFPEGKNFCRANQSTA